jgi:hypothetical protein
MVPSGAWHRAKAEQWLAVATMARRMIFWQGESNSMTANDSGNAVVLANEVDASKAIQ